MRILLLILLAAATGVAADGAIAPPHRLGAGVTQRRITLEEAVEMAIRGNLDVAIERSNVASADQAIAAARGGFDPAMHFQSLAADSNLPSPSVLQGAGGVLTQHLAGQTLA